MLISGLKDKTFLITGVANKKSIATHVAKAIIQSEGKVIFSAQNEKNMQAITKLFPNSPSFILDVENEEDLSRLKENMTRFTDKVDGLLHSIAFANFSLERSLFHQTSREDFLQACQISSFSLVELANELVELFTQSSSIVTVSISNTKATSYGYLGPIKAMLEATVPFLAKSLSQYGHIRVNSVGAGPLKTSASAGIPNYIENYFYSEALTLRKKSLLTEEVANTILFLLSPLSSGINAENIIIDNGMNANYFDQDIVKSYSKNL